MGAWKLPRNRQHSQSQNTGGIAVTCTSFVLIIKKSLFHESLCFSHAFIIYVQKHWDSQYIKSLKPSNSALTLR